MDPKPEVTPPQNPGAGAGTPETPHVEKVELTKEELDDLKHRAEVSSQNFERAKKAEERAKELEALLTENTVPPDPDTERVVHLETKVDELSAELQKSKVLEVYPALKDKWEDLESFRELPENKGMNLRTAAKAFLAEKGLLEPARPGLEKPTGGSHVPVKTGMKAEEVTQLRTSNYKKYKEMLAKGQIQISE